jgi:hypothetical protein
MKSAWARLDRYEALPGYAARGRDARVMIPTSEAFIASWQGFLDEADEARERALAETQTSSLHSRIFAQCFSANCLAIRGDYDRAVQESDAICSLAGELGFPYFVACGLMLKGIAKSGWATMKASPSSKGASSYTAVRRRKGHCPIGMQFRRRARPAHRGGAGNVGRGICRLE